MKAKKETGKLVDPGHTDRILFHLSHTSSHRPVSTPAMQACSSLDPLNVDFVDETRGARRSETLKPSINPLAPLTSLIASPRGSPATTLLEPRIGVGKLGARAPADEGHERELRDL